MIHGEVQSVNRAGFRCKQYGIKGTIVWIMSFSYYTLRLRCICCLLLLFALFIISQFPAIRLTFSTIHYILSLRIFLKLPFTGRFQNKVRILLKSINNECKSSLKRSQLSSYCVDNVATQLFNIKRICHICFPLCYFREAHRLLNLHSPGAPWPSPHAYVWRYANCNFAFHWIKIFGMWQSFEPANSLCDEFYKQWNTIYFILWVFIRIPMRNVSVITLSTFWS